MTEKTKVLYDVNDAIKELDRLNTKVDEAGNKANQSFEKGGRGATLFGKAVDRLRGPVKAAAGTVRTAVGAIASLPGVAVAAAAGIAAVVAQFIDFDGILRDSIKSIEAFNRATDTIQGTKDVFSSLGDAAINRDIRFASRAVRLEQAENARQEVAIKQAQDLSERRLDIVRDELDRRERLLDASLSKEQSLRDRLARRQTRDAAADFGGPAGKRALDLGAAARRAAFEGDIDRAEELERAAKRAAEEAGNHNLFLRDQRSTRESINRSLEKQIQDQEKQTSTYAEQVEEAAGLEDALEAALEKDERRLEVLRLQRRELRAQSKLLRVAGREATETQQADQAARDFENNARDFNNALRNGGQSLGEIVKGFGSEVKRFFSNERQRQRFLNLTRRGAEGAVGIERVLGRVNRGEPVTAEDLEGLRESFNVLTDVVAQLQVARGEDRLSTIQERTLQRLENLLESGQGAIQAGADFREVRGEDRVIAEGTRGPSADDYRALRDSILKLNDSIAEPSRSTQAINAQARSTGAPPPTQAAASNVTVNATVKGGMIDEEVTRKITEIIRRELRKQTTQGVQ